MRSSTCSRGTGNIQYYHAVHACARARLCVCACVRVCVCVWLFGLLCTLLQALELGGQVLTKAMNNRMPSKNCSDAY
eukprot:5958126-Amphidinium_carterae.1